MTLVQPLLKEEGLILELRPMIVVVLLHGCFDFRHGTKEWLHVIGTVWVTWNRFFPNQPTRQGCIIALAVVTVVT
jgi:hypothetical protein